jgi:hypothetical protein
MGLFGRKKPDGVVVGVRYDSGGLVEWVRAYERSGPAWSDWRLIHREAFIEKLKAGKKYFVGERITFQAGTFHTTDRVELVEKEGREYVTAGNASGEGDTLTGVPLV